VSRTPDAAASLTGGDVRLPTPTQVSGELEDRPR
jgi:hypothetical protein